METGGEIAMVEEAVFDNVADTRQTLAYHNTTEASASEPLPNKVATLNAVRGQAMGPAKSLRVREGDTVQLSVKVRYEAMSLTKPQGIEAAATALAQALEGTASRLEAPGTAGGGLDPSGGAALLTGEAAEGAPQAHLNYLVFDEHYQLVDQGFQQVSEAAEVSARQPDTEPEVLALSVVAPANGYLHTYLSNESQADINVYFDDLQVVHRGSHILQATDYYPFGAPIERVAGYGSKYLYQGKEWQTALGLNLYDHHARQYDPYLGRWHVQDPQQQFASPYLAMGNNPISLVDPDGEFVPLVIGIGMMVNVGMQMLNGNINGGADFWAAAAIGGASAALGAGVGAGVSAALAGGSFAAGALGTTGVSATGFLAGAATGTSAGLVNGLVQGTGNALLGGSSFGSALGTGLKQGWQQGAIGGASGGLLGGLDALSKGVNFFTGKGSFDLSNGFGAHGIANKNQTIRARYTGKIKGTNVSVYESKSLGEGYGGAGITLPERGIFVGEGAFSNNLDPFLVKHEFGHILQAREIGIDNFYREVAPQSFVSASSDPYNHKYFWTEKWANRLSLGYFKDGPNWPYSRFPVDSISPQLLRKLTQPKLLNPYGF